MREREREDRWDEHGWVRIGKWKISGRRIPEGEEEGVMATNQ